MQAVQELSSNPLRSFLSSLGITIGIFCIISVMSAVDSLEDNITQSFEKLGSDVLYIDRRPWNENPHENWWKYMRRPMPDLEDMQAIQARVADAQASSLSVFVPSRTITYRSSNVRGAYMLGITYDYQEITKLEFAAGRYFTSFEYRTAANTLILGNTIAKELFGDPASALDKEVKLAGLKFRVIGILEDEGNSLIDPIPFDEAVIVSYNALKKMVNVRTGSSFGQMLSVKAKSGMALDDLRDQVTGVLRSHRKLRPKEEDNFAINQLSIVTNALEQLFGVMNLVGIIIGVFAVIVGIFSVANIMFVSVKERTNLIGIKKALGAKRGIILFEFLIESVLLCTVGGAIGLLVVAGVLEVASSIFNYEMYVSFANMSVAIVLAIVIGVVAGLIPAIQAARMDPVEAMRA